MSRENALPIVYASMVFLLSACATAASGGDLTASSEKPLRGVAAFADDPRLGEEVKSACFASSIDGFRDNTRETVVLEVSPSRDVLVDVGRGCSDMVDAATIGLASHSLCLRKGDRLLVSDSFFGLSQSGGRPADRCLIRGIYAWDEDAAEATEANSAE